MDYTEKANLDMERGAIDCRNLQCPHCGSRDYAVTKAVEVSTKYRDGEAMEDEITGEQTDAQIEYSSADEFTFECQNYEVCNKDINTRNPMELYAKEVDSDAIPSSS